MRLEVPAVADREETREEGREQPAEAAPAAPEPPPLEGETTAAASEPAADDIDGDQGGEAEARGLPAGQIALGGLAGLVLLGSGLWAVAGVWGLVAGGVAAGAGGVAYARRRMGFRSRRSAAWSATSTRRASGWSPGRGRGRGIGGLLFGGSGRSRRLGGGRSGRSGLGLGLGRSRSVRGHGGRSLGLGRQSSGRGHGRKPRGGVLGGLLGGGRDRKGRRRGGLLGGLLGGGRDRKGRRRGGLLGGLLGGGRDRKGRRRGRSPVRRRGDRMRATVRRALAAGAGSWRRWAASVGGGVVATVALLIDRRRKKAGEKVGREDTQADKATQTAESAAQETSGLPRCEECGGEITRASDAHRIAPGGLPRTLCTACYEPYQRRQDTSGRGADANKTNTGDSTTSTRRRIRMDNNASGGFPLAVAAAEVNTVAAGYAPPDMWAVANDIGQLPDVFASLGLAMRTYASRLEGGYAINPVVVERLGELYMGVLKLAESAQEIEPLFRAVHAADIARRETPRVGEDGWNV